MKPAPGQASWEPAVSLGYSGERGCRVLAGQLKYTFRLSSIATVCSIRGVSYSSYDSYLRTRQCAL